MSSRQASDLASRGLILDRLATFGLEADDEVVEGCAQYLHLLTRWNARINLTALPLDPLTDATVDKLIVEPLAATALFPEQAVEWVDLGSGGGSPAIPLRIARRAGHLTMIESREKKCGFLREVVRSLGLARTDVLNARFEAFAPTKPLDLVSVRAVRMDQALLSLVSSWMSMSGAILSFGSPIVDDRFEAAGSLHLPDGSELTRFRHHR